MADNTTNFRNVGIGSSLFTSGLVSAAVAGSLILGGNTYTDRELNTTVNNYYGTGSYMSYDDVVCTNTGGLAKYNSCYLANPISGTAAIMRLQVDSYKAPTAARITCVTTPIGSTTGTASILINNALTFSGSSLTQSGSALTGANSNARAMTIVPGGGVRCWHSATPGPGLKEQMRLWYNAQYVP